MFPKVKKLKKRIYLDYAATTPVDSEVLKAMQPFWQERFGNPSAIYQEGREAKEAVGVARSDASLVLNCKPQEIIFTAGGTESVNLAIFGVVKKLLKHAGKKLHLITSKIEHHSVLRAFEDLQNQGLAITFLDVDKYGFISLKDLEKNIRPETVFISIMYANNEIGSVQPIAEIGKLVKGLSHRRLQNHQSRIFFHTDASQAAGALDLNVEKLNVDLLSLNGSKIYGPKQTGLLYVKNGVSLESLVFGGGQEQNLRSGTENVPGIVGLVKALQLAQKSRNKNNANLIKLRNYFYTQIIKKIPNVFLNGPEIDKKNNFNRLPNNLNLSFLGLEGESLMLYLDSYGISVATGSACTEAISEPSHVLKALNISNQQIAGSVRMTLGKETKKSDLDFVLKVLPDIVTELRKVQSIE